MKPIALCFLVAAMAISDAQAADSDIRRRLTDSVERAAAEARRSNLSRLVVAVRGPDESATALATIQRELLDLLENEQLECVVSEAAAAALAEQDAGQLIDPQQVRQLQQQTEFDAVLSADYLVNGNRVTLRLSLVDGQRRQFLRAIRLPAQPQPQQTAGTANTTAANRQSAATQQSANAARSALAALSTLTAQAPPTTEGCSGMRRQRDPGDENSANTSNEGEGDSNNDSSNQNGNDEDGQNADRQCQPLEGDAAELNNRIVQFAVANLGQQVGNGECWTLAADALAAADAQPPQLYDFGQEIELSQMQPGDILQFTSARFDLPNQYILLGMPDHTAIVYALKDGQTFVLHQNFGERTVSVLGIDWNTMTAGSVQAYRAVPADVQTQTERSRKPSSSAR